MLAATLLLIAVQPTTPNQPRAANATAAVTPPRSPRPLQQLISPDDYPSEALKARQQGSVGIMLDVTAEGRISSCQILESSRSTALDVATCRLLYRRARLIPARDTRTGAAVTGQVADVIVWDLKSARR